MAAHKIPIWSCIHVPTSSNTPPDVVRFLSQVKSTVRIILLHLIMPFSSFKKFRVLIFRELMKVFCAGFLLLHSQRKLENGAEPSHLHQSTTGTNSLGLSSWNLIVMTTTRYMMKLIIYGNKMNP